MPIRHAEELEQRVASLMRDVGPLHTVAGLGFEADAKVVAATLGALRQREGWAVVDLRDASAEQAAGALAAQVGAKTVVLVVRPEKPQPGVVAWVRAVVDRQAELELSEGRSVQRREDQSLALLCPGARSIEGVERELKRVSYWDFVS